MSTTSPMRCTGLTLLELLTATLILSAIAASGAALLRDAGAARRRAELVHMAREAVERWEQRRLDDLAEGGAAASNNWEWTDRRQRRWRVRPDVLSDRGWEPGAVPQQPALAWQRYTIETQDADEPSFHAFTTLLVPVPLHKPTDAEPRR